MSIIIQYSADLKIRVFYTQIILQSKFIFVHL